MNLEKYVVIAGLPGVHKMVTSRGNGLIIEDLHEGRTRFVAVRQNQITPLGTVSVYVDTEEGTVPLVDVFQKMLDQRESIPPVSANGSSVELRDYFSKILPEHDRDRVHIHDIKKCLKWFTFLQAKGIFEEISKEPPAAENPETQPEEPAA